MMNLLKKNLSCSLKLLNVGWCTELSQHIAPIWEKTFYFLETLKAYKSNSFLSYVEAKSMSFGKHAQAEVNRF
jgi:hypothetical protein